MTDKASVEKRKIEERRPTHRDVVERIVVTGILTLETPAHFGNGDADAFTDMPLLEDELDGSPLLPGTSIAGALRSYLREREVGDWEPLPRLPQHAADEKEKRKEERRFKTEQESERKLAASILFGGYRGDEDGWQSPLIVHDALGHTDDYELRDGVKIDLQTRTAEDDKKFDMRLLAAGATFDLRFELTIGVPDGADVNDRPAIEAHRKELLKALVTALTGLEKGEITLGARKRRGFGRCSVSKWTVCRYDMAKRADLLAWLAESRGAPDALWTPPVEPKTATSILEALRKALGTKIDLHTDKRKRFVLEAIFEMDGSLMVRSGFGESDCGPDMIHLHSPRRDKHGALKRRPILAGTSWAGVLRSRATQIANTLATDRSVARRLIDRMFGPEEIKAETREAWASRIEVAESVIDGGRLLEQSRVKIDRFTGGAFESALFSEQPLFGGSGSRVSLKLSLRLPEAKTKEDQTWQQAEIGLLLLLLKDLWTGDLPLGGEVSVGRGRLKGVKASLALEQNQWVLIRSANDGVTVEGEKQTLQEFVNVLKEVFDHE